MFRILLSVVGMMLGLLAFTQELNCTVQVISPLSDVTGDQNVYNTLKNAVFEFVNTRKWTNDSYAPEERIECSMLLKITERISTDEFSGSIQVQLRRPVYNTSYNSLLLNINDNDFKFKYIEFEPLEFSESTHMSELTSVLAFYIYIALGLDYDSFSLEGGDPFYQKAQTIVNNAQNSRSKGWKAFENTNNRYWLIENLLNKVFQPLRSCIYQYHRKGLDNMTENIEKAREEITKSLDPIKKVYNEKPGAYLLQVFFNAKADELVDIYSKTFPDEKLRVVRLLSQIDPGNGNKYQKITRNN